MGNVGTVHGLRKTADGTPVLNFNVATDDRFNDRNGKLQERTDWHQISVWGELAVRLSEKIKTSQLVEVEGSIRNRSYTSKEGVEVKSYEIRAKRVIILDYKDKPKEASHAENA